ncbi:MAG TPA: PhzF family phenazine biosynthesis protein [Alphaproteobacteria bacterium]|nr:PhzF family phenazine biosynthesis protein [Alphaproteobacteria bacterium]
MRLPIYQIDAFASAVFKGNPAAVVPLDQWLPDAMLQAIALENNLSETAFFVPEGELWRLRWFTPAVEVDLCGHATLATAHLIFTRLAPDRDRVEFMTRSGRIAVTRKAELLELDFPAVAMQVRSDAMTLDALEGALGCRPAEAYVGMDQMAVFREEGQVAGLKPDMARIAALGGRGLIATAPGETCDFVSRFFGPAVGIPEDPVTGSAHTVLTPFWAKRLGKTKLAARQISARGGELLCEDRGERVGIAGRAVLYLEGAIFV